MCVHMYVYKYMYLHICIDCIYVYMWITRERDNSIEENLSSKKKVNKILPCGDGGIAYVDGLHCFHYCIFIYKLFLLCFLSH